MRALVVGGTGPTGPLVVNGLRARGYTVTILHRGTHEVDEIPPDVEHIHADPHFAQSLEPALSGRTFDLVVSMYGRLHVVARAVRAKTARFIGIGGPLVYRGAESPWTNRPSGMSICAKEDSALDDADGSHMTGRMQRAELDVMAGHGEAAYAATLFRYPFVYGPRQLAPREWSVVRRILDRRPFIVLPDGGLTIVTYGYVENVAHAVLLAVDQPDVSAGKIYNCGDEQALSVRQRVEIMAQGLDHSWEIVSAPASVVPFAHGLLSTVATTTHHMMYDLTKIKQELGYRDVVSPEEALVRTARWYSDHPLERGGELERTLRDPFDYANEDGLVAALQRLAASAATAPEVVHPYPHPKEIAQRDHRNR